MVTDHRSQNPYAAPVSTEVATDKVASHHSFQRVQDKLRCRSGLQLPMYCLVTGGSEDLVPLPLSLWAPGKSLRRYRFAGVGLMAGAPIVVGLINVFHPGPPARPLLAVLLISAPLILGLVLFLLGGRRGQICILQGMVNRKRLAWGRRLTAVPAWIFLLFLATSTSAGLSSGYGTAVVALCFVCGQLFSSQFLLRGTQLRAALSEDGMFELSGFSRAFLKRLEESSDAR